MGPRTSSGGVPRPTAPGPLAATVGDSFLGFGFDDNATENGGSLSIPPDPMGAAGTDRVIAVVNRMIEARSKTGALLFRDSLRDFFASLPLIASSRDFDPKVIYDHYEDRFLVVALELIEAAAGTNPGNVSRLLLAVSKTGTPATPTAADWWFQAIDSKTSISGFDHWADYPGFEVDEEAVYITANMFQHVLRGFGGVRLWIVDKGTVGGFYAGGTPGVSVHNPIPPGGIAGTTMPAEVYGVGGVGPGIGTFLVTYSGITTGGPGGLESIQVVRVNNPLGTPTFTLDLVAIGDIEDLGGIFGFPALPDAPQSGTATLIEVNDRRALDAVWRDGNLWLTTTILPNAGPSVGETTAHWVRLDTSGVVDSTSGAGLITLGDQGDIHGEDIVNGLAEVTTFFPAVAVNASGDAMFGFSASAASIFAGAYVAGRRATDPPGTVRASETVQAGLDFYVRTFGGSRNRWGDYSGIALDPVDDNVFWVFNEFADLRGTPTNPPFEDGRWGTAWARATYEGVVSDFNADSRSDILWRHPTDGTNVMWLMDGFTRLGAQAIHKVAPPWEVAGVGDVDGGGRADILWRHPIDGTDVMWLMDGFTRLGTQAIQKVPAPWEVAGLGDVDGSGQVDILWRHPIDGTNVIWLMDGFTRLGAQAIQKVPAPWEVADLGDIDGDTKADILWRHPIDGTNVIWLMDGFTRLGAQAIQKVPAPWEVAGVGDVDGGGRADILWRHPIDGTNVIWLMDGFTRLGAQAIQKVPSPWEVQ